MIKDEDSADAITLDWIIKHPGVHGSDMSTSINSRLISLEERGLIIYHRGYTGLSGWFAK